MVVTTFRDEQEALAVAYDTIYGLGAGVWTRDASRAFRMGRGIKAGRVWANCYHLYPAGAALESYTLGIRSRGEKGEGRGKGEEGEGGGGKARTIN